MEHSHCKIPWASLCVLVGCGYTPPVPEALDSRMEWLLARASDACSTLSPAATADGRKLVGLCRTAFVSRGAVDQVELRRQLGTLVELLARREARAMPFASLGRAALAHLLEQDRDRDALLSEFDLKLSMFGL